MSDDVLAEAPSASSPSAKPTLGVPTPPPVRTATRWVWASVVGAGAGVAVGVAALTIGAGTGHIEAIGQFVQDFVKSPGLGGIAALVAAMIAYRGIKGQVETSRAALASQQAAEEADRWWTTFQWTADRALPSVKLDVPLPEPVAIATLKELAVTATDDAQQIACAGLVNTLGSKAEALLEEPDDSSEASQEALRSVKATEAAAQEAMISAALASYARATAGSLAESSVAQERTFEIDALAAVERTARSLGLEYEREPYVGMDDERSRGRHSRADAAVVSLTGRRVLIAVHSSPRVGGISSNYFRRLANNGRNSLLIISPFPQPKAMEEFPASTRWLQWKPNDITPTLTGTLREMTMH
ncbi:hypothetical protein [Microbacterium sp. NPDC089696]|uniref:hypothetical protein n=1 Tax=Microbacterium sp. NPDC089696 TaxID=3364199 RepID=UPI00381EFC39